ncbi:MAG: cupin domain-containing protein [Chitinophagaceae bacterium]
MKEKHTDATPQRPDGGRSIDSSLLFMDLPVLMEQIKNEAAWKTSDRNAITVFKSENMRIVLIALHEGTEVKRHTANGTISVQVMEGQIKFSTDKQSLQLNKGQMLTLHERIPHSVLAIKEAMFLLTLSVNMPEKQG